MLIEHDKEGRESDAQLIIKLGTIEARNRYVRAFFYGHSKGAKILWSLFRGPGVFGLSLQGRTYFDLSQGPWLFGPSSEDRLLLPSLGSLTLDVRRVRLL